MQPDRFVHGVDPLVDIVGKSGRVDVVDPRVDIVDPLVWTGQPAGMGGSTLSTHWYGPADFGDPRADLSDQ